MQGIMGVVSLVSALAAAAAAVFAAIAVREMKKQMEQMTDHQFAQLSNEHNWNLYDRRQELPPALIAWKDLSDTGWAWRVLHLNHLNLLWLAYRDHERGLMNESDFESWKRKAKYWFSGLAKENTDVDMKEGCRALRPLLEREEAWSPRFRQWLLDSRIIPMNVLSENHQ